MEENTPVNNIQQPTITPTKSTHWLMLVVIVLLVAFIASIGTYYYINNSNLKDQNSKPQFKAQNLKPTPTINPTSNWKSYADPKQNFSFKYPPVAKITTNEAFSMLSNTASNATNITTPYVNVDNQGYIIDIVTRDNPQNDSAKTVINKYLSEVEKNCSQPACSLPQAVKSTLKEYVNGAINGYIFHIGAETDSVMVVQIKNNKTYIFRVSNGEGNATDQGIKIFGQILSTFKFIDQNQISSKPIEDHTQISKESIIVRKEVIIQQTPGQPYFRPYLKGYDEIVIKKGELFTIEGFECDSCTSILDLKLRLIDIKDNSVIVETQYTNWQNDTIEITSGDQIDPVPGMMDVRDYFEFQIKRKNGQLLLTYKSGGVSTLPKP